MLTLINVNIFKKITIGLILIVLGTSAYADKQDDVIHLDVTKTEIELNEQKNEEQEFIKNDSVNDNIDTEFSIFNDLLDRNKDKDHPFKIEEESLFGRIYQKKLERTSIPSFLLKEELTHDFKKGPIDRMQFYAGYQGNMKFDFTGSDYDTDYDTGFLTAGVIGDFNDKDTNFKLQLNFKRGDNRSYLQGLVTDAYIMSTKIPHHKVIIGNSRNQVGFEGGMSSFVLPFAMRSQIARNFGNTRALGVRVVGDYSLADYSLAFNSSQRYFKDFFPGVEFTGWVNLKPLGKTDGKYGNFVIGGGLNAGHNKTDYTVASAYASYAYKKFKADFEYQIADGYNGTYRSTDKAAGFYTTLSYRLTKRLHILARYDQFDPNRDITNNKSREYTVGLNYFLKGQALRLILNYVFCDRENGQDSHRIIVGTQILL